MSSNYGVKISMPDVEVTEARLKELILSSDYPLLKIVDIVSGSASLTDTGGGFDIQVYEHNLGYRPRYYLWATYYDPFLDTMINDYELMPLTEMSSGGVIGMFYIADADNSEITFSGETFGGDNSNHTIYYYCIIYYDED
jgi:hypothetical protein